MMDPDLGGALGVTLDRRSEGTPMSSFKLPEVIDRPRRRFLRTAAMSIAAARIGMWGSARAQSGKTPPAERPRIKAGANTSFSSLKQIDAGVLNIGYAEAGPIDGPAVILLHGWPYDIHSYVDVAPALASAGYRVIVPYLRGYGTTCFLSAERSATASRLRSPSTSLR